MQMINFPEHFTNGLYFRDGDTFTFVRHATDEEVVTAFKDEYDIETGDGKYHVLITIDDVERKCYIWSPMRISWNQDRTYRDNVMVNDGEETYFYHSNSAADEGYDPVDDMESFELKYDHSGISGKVSAVLTNLVTGEEYPWEFTDPQEYEVEDENEDGEDGLYED